MMKNIKDVSLDEAKNWSNAAYMPEGLVLTDCITDAPIPQEPRRMNYILMALCRRGRAQYSIDTRELKVEPGDLLFISENHIVDNYMASPDFECLCIMVSKVFYHSFVLNTKNVSSLLLFSTNNPVVALTPQEINADGQSIYDINRHFTHRRITCRMWWARTNQRNI